MATPKYPTDWQLRNLDTNETVLPPFPMTEDGVSIDIGGKIVEQDRFGFQNPITQWVGGRSRTFSFTAKMFSRDAEEDVRAQLKQFELLAVKDSTLGRPPVVLFTLGDVISEIVLVESVNPTINKMRQDGRDFKAREVTLSMFMRRYTPFRQRQIDPTRPVKESYQLQASGALATYEAIARRYYGNPLLGDRLRKRHPERPLAPEVGKLVKIPARDVIVSERIEPAFHALSLTDADAVRAFEYMVEKRSARKIVEIV